MTYGKKFADVKVSVFQSENKNFRDDKGYSKMCDVKNLLGELTLEGETWWNFVKKISSCNFKETMKGYLQRDCGYKDHVHKNISFEIKEEKDCSIVTWEYCWINLGPSSYQTIYHGVIVQTKDLEKIKKE